MLMVLVVDDDADMRLLTRRLLTTLGCESLEAKNGIECETVAMDRKPSMILLDVMMPVQDGFETCVHLRSKGYSGSIILMSAMQETSGKLKAQQVGATAYIQKPMSRDVLKIHLDHAKNQEPT